MCGFAGLINTSFDFNDLKKMGDALSHRGPDDEGYYISNHIGLVFRRLSIVDIAMGHQPMLNEDESVVVVFNGEIYNHTELRRELVNKGYNFRTNHSDTEVIIHGWIEWGTKLFNRLNGMFAIGIWCVKTQSLILARDRYGIKPLYYTLDSAFGLIFGSEIKALLASNKLVCKPSYHGILEYFSFQNLWQTNTMFNDISQAEPGCYYIYRNKHLTCYRYWDLEFKRSRKDSLKELANEHREILCRAVHRHIAADVPVSTYLSGGIDSAAITIAAHQFHPNIKAYSCIFDLSKVAEQAHFDEREYSRLIAKEYSIDRVEHIISPYALMECIDDYVYALEDLRMGMGYVNYLIAQRVAMDTKVVLSGTGGDEYHGGYVGRYEALGLTNHIRKKSNRLLNLPLMEKLTRYGKKHKLSLLGNSEREHLYKSILNSVFKQHQFEQIFSKDFLAHAVDFDANGIMDKFLKAAPTDDWFDKVLYVDAKTYLTGLLSFEDKVSMAHSLETRVPLMDNELIDFILDVPKEYLCQGGVGKVIFRESVKPWVPRSIYNKPKMGFGPPDADWYRNELRNWISDELSVKKLEQQSVFNPSYVNNMLEQHFSGRVNNTYIIWTILNFQRWCSIFKINF